MAHFHKGDRVSWAWGAHRAHGVIAQSFVRRVRRTIDGTTVIRNANADEPAYLIRQEDGGRVLKSASELDRS